MTWRKASGSQGTGGECVELARIPDLVGIRDSKDPQGPTLTFAPHLVRAFANRITGGDYDL